MAICSYLVIPERGAAEAVAVRLAALPGCDVVRAVNRDALLLVTETACRAAESALRARVEAMEGIHALVLTFGEIEPEAGPTDPLPPTASPTEP